MLIDLKALRRAVEQVSEEKGVKPEKVIDAIESSIAAAYKKEYEKKGEIIRSEFDMKTGNLKFYQVKIVVDETTVRLKDEEEEVAETEAEEGEEEKLPRFNADRHIMIDEAEKIQSGVLVGEEISFPLEPKDDFGRIAAQAAKQVILQKLREAERESIVSEFKGREGEIVSGTVQRIERGNVFVDLGRATAIMLYKEAIPGERYRVGERLKFYIVDVQDDSRMASILLSRSHPEFVRGLFALEIPEMTDGTIEIKSVAREPGSRTKIAVASNEEGVDPVGSCVGQRGTRVMAVSNELGNEKIDIIEWSEDPAEFIASAMSPAEVEEVEILPDEEARIFVMNDQLSLAIGRGGQNVRLAARLTGWKIDVRSYEDPDADIADLAGDRRSEDEAEDVTEDAEEAQEEIVETETETPEEEEGEAPEETEEVEGETEAAEDASEEKEDESEDEASEETSEEKEA